MQNKPLQNSENNFLDLLNFIVDPAVIVDEKGRILLTNNALEDISGLSAKEVIGKVFLEVNLLSAESKAIVLENLKKRMQGLPVEPYEITFTNKNGELKYAEVKAKKISYAGQPASLVIFRDITRRKKNLAKLKEYSEKMEALVNEKVKEIEESKERYRELTESISDVFFAMDKDLKYTYWNKASEKLTGILAKDAIGKSLTEVFPDVKGTRVEQFYQEVLRTKQSQSFLNKFRIGDRDFVFEINAYPTMTGLSVFVKDITEHKRMEETLQKSEERFKQVADNAQEWIWEVDSNGLYTYASLVVEKVLGYKPEEIVGKKHFYDLFHPEEREELKKAAFQAFANKSPFRGFLNRNVHKNGNMVWLSTSGVPIVDEKGGLLGYRGADIDITERKKAEEELRMSEEKYRELINGMNDTAWVIGLDGMFIDVNDVAVRVLGYSREELLSMGPWDIDSSLSREQIVDLVTRMPADQIQVFETSHTTKDGKKIPVEISSSLVTYQGKQAILSIARNITERKKAEKKLLASEKKYRELFENLKLTEAQLLEERDIAQNYLDIADVMLVALDTEGHITMLNRKGCEILKCTAEEALGKSWFDNFIPPKIRSNVKKYFRLVIAGKAKFPEYHENPVLSKNEDIRLIWWHNTALRNRQGQIIGTLSSGEDITEWKQAQQALVDSEEKFRLLAEQSPNMVFVNKKGRVVYANKKAEEIMGYTKKEFYSPSFNFLCLIAPESKEQIKSVYERHLKNGKDVGPLEYRLVTKDGRVIDAILTSRLIMYEGDNAILGTVIDITERKQLEEDLRSSEEKFRAISASAVDAIVLLDETDKVIYWNPAAERIFGFTTEEAVGKEFWNLVVPQESREHHLMLLEKLVHQKGQIPEKRIDIKALRKDGTEFPIELSATALKLKDRICLLEIIRDVSERKKMEAEVQQKLDMLEALTENLGVGLGVISKDYRVLWMNKFIKNNTGDVTGKLCYSSFNTLDHICPDCGVRKVFEEGVARDSHEYSTIGIHGKPYYVELIATPLKDKDGNITAALEFVVDIAEKKRMQSELTKYSQKLEQLVAKRTEQLKQTQAKLLKAEKLAVIGELAGMVGHDLRNPLTGIKGAAYYLKTKYAAEIGATGKEMLETIDKAIEHSNKIINDLLAYSSKLSLELSETTPKLLLKNALALIEVPERIQIIDDTKGKPKIKADIENMRKVFVNLITNAIDAMPRTGTLTITSKAAKGNVKIVFKDTGTGMTEETLSKLESPLFTTKAKGMGFGLPICKRIVEAHGGKISLKSRLGKGTAVTIIIPVNPKPVKEGEEKWIFNESALQALRTAQEAP